jgi:hypothetical protein
MPMSYHPVFQDPPQRATRLVPSWRLPHNNVRYRNSVETDVRETFDRLTRDQVGVEPAQRTTVEVQ